jgi:hypothetical protein
LKIDQSGPKLTMSRLLETLYMLDCYRVVIMYRPPSFPWRHTNSFAQPNSAHDGMKELCRYPAALADFRQPHPLKGASASSLAALASLSGYLWTATTQAEGIARADDPDLVLDPTPSVWKTDFVEMASENWLRAQRDPSPPALAMYHHMSTMLHANLVHLQRFAHSSPKSPARDPEKSGIAKAVHAWLTGRDYEIARWHASQLIGSIEAAINITKSTTGVSDSRILASSMAQAPSEARRRIFEAPHTPFAVYFASLVLWCGELADDMKNSSVASAKAHLARGEMILSAHKARIAQLLARALIEIR